MRSAGCGEKSSVGTIRRIRRDAPHRRWLPTVLARVPRARSGSIATNRSPFDFGTGWPFWVNSNFHLWCDYVCFFGLQV
jgi:hypothetical protein